MFRPPCDGGYPFSRSLEYHSSASGPARGRPARRRLRGRWRTSVHFDGAETMAARRQVPHCDTKTPTELPAGAPAHTNLRARAARKNVSSGIIACKQTPITKSQNASRDRHGSDRGDVIEAMSGIEGRRREQGGERDWKNRNKPKSVQQEAAPHTSYHTDAVTRNADTTLRGKQLHSYGSGVHLRKHSLLRARTRPNSGGIDLGWARPAQTTRANPPGGNGGGLNWVWRRPHMAGPEGVEEISSKQANIMHRHIISGRFHVPCASGVKRRRLFEQSAGPRPGAPRANVKTGIAVYHTLPNMREQRRRSTPPFAKGERDEGGSAGGDTPCLQQGRQQRRRRPKEMVVEPGKENHKKV